MLIDIPDTIPFIAIAQFATSQGCHLQTNTKAGFTFVPTKDLFNLNAAKKIKANQS